MPGNFGLVDVSFPDFSSMNTEAKFSAMENYLRLLLENLQYALRHLDMSNMNESEMNQWLGDTIRAQELISNTVITNEIYSDYGSIADLTVNKLRTDYTKAQYFLYGITDPIDYIYIHDEEIQFITATVQTGHGFEQMHDGDTYFYWKDATQTQMTSQEVTDFPVFVYLYDELVKGSIKFGYTTSAGEQTTMPIITLGAGLPEIDDPTGTYSKAKIWKDTDGLYIQYVTNLGKVLSIKMRNDNLIQLNGALVLGPESYGTEEPTGTPADGQLYFKIVE